MALLGAVDLFNKLNLTNLSKNNSHELLEMFLFLYNKNNINHNYIFNNAKNLVIFEEDKSELKSILNENSNLLSKNIVKIILNKNFSFNFTKIIVKRSISRKFLI